MPAISALVSTRPQVAVPADDGPDHDGLMHAGVGIHAHHRAPGGIGADGVGHHDLVVGGEGHPERLPHLLEGRDLGLLPGDGIDGDQPTRAESLPVGHQEPAVGKARRVPRFDQQATRHPDLHQERLHPIGGVHREQRLGAVLGAVGHDDGAGGKIHDSLPASGLDRTAAG
jgi:hypothetical protein